MAHSIQNMDRKSPSNTVFARLSLQKTENLDPVPVSPRMVKCDQESSVRPQKQISSSFINFKIEIPNDSAKKRKLDDSSPNYCSGSKKPCIPVSPDFGCFMDYSSPLGRQDSMSPFIPSYPALSENTQTCKVETKESVSTRLDLEHIESGSLSYPTDEVETEHSCKRKKILPRLSSTFDDDIDDILSINPLSQIAKEGHKEAKPALVDVEDDKGYVSTSHDQKEERHSESSPEPQHHEQVTISGQQASFLNDGLNNSGLLLKPANSSVRCLEGGDEEEGMWNIGAPLFESSVCQPSPGLEPKMQASEVVTEPDYVCNTYSPGHSTLETTYEDSLPLQVQVKSKVEIPGRPAISKPTLELKAYQNRDQTVQSAKNVKSQRSNIWKNKTEWERQKRQYVASVTSHMTENQNTTQGFVSELQDLMTHVSEQRGSNGAHWRHPSDLTCRNYQKRFCNEIPSMTLGEWRAKNLISHKRFCNVPKIFERSPFP
ncbi:uncharacterized protein LOC121631004 [Melanotaenia boesemani]|uniref:uncharacterized protein LOC121631004 n=1 Tax=Melanotaenia boesemani TaxID=1250792 RepID=UPI001C04455C|nr:uncharacterized protein LOC121631004 [Melanotaenia boesemani]XP_041827533.1 uncharacterized protein LOC121631004 [Melanotaenia boesemani]